MNFKKAVFTVFSTLMVVAAYSSTKETVPYKNPSLPVETRVNDLLGRMTLEEKLDQIRHVHSWDIFNNQELVYSKLENFCKDISWGFVEGFPLTGENCKKNFHEIQKYMVEKTRLGIPVFTVAESLHGVVQEGCTIYPQNIAIGSTFNPDLAYRATSAISEELHELGIRQVLAPCVDVVRDLRWGRVEESFGEDPFLCGTMGIAQVKGYMDHGISPMLKHYGPHGNPVGGLNLASVDCGIRDLHEVYLKPFEMVLQSTPVMAVMSSYNSWNRVPNSASKYLLTDILRNKFGFKGYVYSDWGVIEMLKSFHHTAANDFEASRQVMTSGLDVEASSNSFPALADGVKNGYFDVKYIDLAVSRVLKAKFEMGLFEDPYGEKYSKMQSLHSNKSVQLSRQIAEESTVLLKNENNLLPLNIEKLKSIAVIGPNADQVEFGDYTWTKNNEDGVTPLAGIRQWAGSKVEVNYAAGCDLGSLNKDGFAQAVTAAEKSDIALIFCGSSSTALVRSSKVISNCGEGMDLSDISLSGVQQELVEAVCKTGKPVVFVLVSGKPFAIPWIKDHVPAILVQWYSGEQAGNAIADILFGKVNPSARITFSFPQSTGHLPAYYNYLPTDKGFYKTPGTNEHPGRDYVFSSPAPLWAFGHGLSYTNFDYLEAKTDKQTYKENDSIRVSVRIKNSGEREGKEVVQVYVRDVVSTIMSPVKQLKAFTKISLKPNEEKTCTLIVPVSELALMDETGQRFIEDGIFEIQVGKASDNIVQTCTIRVGGSSQSELSNNANQNGVIKRSGNKVTVQGVVRDVQGTPIAGIDISIGQSKAAKVSTNEKGEYQIEADEQDQLEFIKKGFQKQVVPVDKQSVINIRMVYGN